MIIDNRFPALTQLLGAYFHQDWADEFETDTSALAALVTGEPKSRLAEGAKEIELLLNSHLSESDLGAVLVEHIGCYFEPASIGFGQVDWLRRVQEILREGSE